METMAWSLEYFERNNFTPSKQRVLKQMRDFSKFTFFYNKNLKIHQIEIEQ